MKTLFQSNQVSNFFAVLGGFIGWYMGAMDELLILLVALVVVDYITGLLRAIHEKSLSSRIGRHGITKKAMIFLIVGLANVLDAYLFNGDNAVLRTAAIGFYASNEGLSIIENSISIGLPVPQKIKDALKQLNSNEEDKNESL